jgi:hypothetical protein
VFTAAGSKKTERAYNIRGPWDATDNPNSFVGPSSAPGPGNAWEHTMVDNAALQARRKEEVRETAQAMVDKAALQARRKEEVASAKAAAKTAKAALQVTRKEDVDSAKAAKEAEKVAAAAVKKAAKEAGELVAAALQEAATQRRVRLLLLVRTCSRTTITTTTT